MSSKLDRADAQEWLESLQQVGEGWYRQVALAVRANAHKALGMERREFAQTIGQKMIDPREAIIELHREGHNASAIADVLGVSRDRTVNRILAEEGLIEWTPDVARKALESGYEAPTGVADADEPEETSVDDAEIDALEVELERLAVQLKGEQAKRREERKEAQEKLKELRKELTAMKRQAKKSAEDELTEVERERARKEAEAWAAEEGRKILAGISHLAVEGIVGNLEDATEELRLLIEQDAITVKVVKRLEKAFDGFYDELEVARMKVTEEGARR
jgi:hypothetical protein